MKARILIVEDEQIVGLDLRRNLERLGHEVLAVVSSGEVAVAKAAENSPDLVLMDIKLNGAVDGIEAAARIGAVGASQVIFLTAYGDAQSLERARNLSPAGIIRKPFEAEELRAMVAAALRGRPRDGQADGTP